MRAVELIHVMTCGGGVSTVGSAAAAGHDA
jgi:hypothetical protein